MNSLMSEMKDAENVDSEEHEELQKNVKDFQSRLARANDFISKVSCLTDKGKQNFIPSLNRVMVAPHTCDKEL